MVIDCQLMSFCYVVGHCPDISDFYVYVCCWKVLKQFDNYKQCMEISLFTYILLCKCMLMLNSKLTSDNVLIVLTLVVYLYA